MALGPPSSSLCYWLYHIFSINYKKSSLFGFKNYISSYFISSDFYQSGELKIDRD